MPTRLSATLAGERFAALLGGAPVIASEGRGFPIDYRHIGRSSTRLEDDLAAAGGADASGLDETIDPAWADAALPAHLPVQGNLDPLALIAGGEALRHAVARIRAAFPRRPHVFNLGHGILPDTPVSHVEALIAMVRG